MKKASKIVIILVATMLLVIIGSGTYQYIKNKNQLAKTSNVPEFINNHEAEPLPADQSLSTSDINVPATIVSNNQESQKWPILIDTSRASDLNVIVNKKYKLPKDYVPNLLSIDGFKLRSETSGALINLMQDAKNQGIQSIKIISGYRSYANQEQLYISYVAKDGQAIADTYSARPGHSEHQTGLAVDIGEGGKCDLELCFENTATSKWLAINAYKYGFVIRYHKGQEQITGYQYEPWHLRYIGVSEAQNVFNSSKTLEEYYNIEGGGY